jgi:DNA-binding transcriptional regulator GbsR (MarR family)
MARTSKSNKYAVLWLNHSGMNADDIATELGMELKQVVSVLEKNINTTSENSVKTTSEPVSTTPKDLMIRHTSNKKTNSVAIMTKEASELSDSKRNQTTNPNIQKHIFRPNG